MGGVVIYLQYFMFWEISYLSDTNGQYFIIIAVISSKLTSELKRVDPNIIKTCCLVEKMREQSRKEFAVCSSEFL